MHSFLPIHEILLDAKSDHDLRFFPSMLRNNLAGKVTLESLAAGMGVGEVKEEGPRAPVAEGPAPEIAAAPNGQ